MRLSKGTSRNCSCNQNTLWKAKAELEYWTPSMLLCECYCHTPRRIGMCVLCFCSEAFGGGARSPGLIPCANMATGVTLVMGCVACWEVWLRCLNRPLRPCHLSLFRELHDEQEGALPNIEGLESQLQTLRDRAFGSLGACVGSPRIRCVGR